MEVIKLHYSFRLLRVGTVLIVTRLTFRNSEQKIPYPAYYGNYVNKNPSAAFSYIMHPSYRYGQSGDENRQCIEPCSTIINKTKSIGNITLFWLIFVCHPAIIRVEVFMMNCENELITAHALAAALNLSVETIWRYTRENKIPYIELGNRQYRYNLSQVVAALSGFAVRETGPDYKNSDKKYTYQDYLEMPEEPGYLFEVLDGRLVKEPAPSVPHQRASRRLQRILEDYFWTVDPEGEIFYAPLEVTLDDTNVVQPDILYVSGEQKAVVEYARVGGSPALIVEILSPSTIRKDRLKKLQIYQRAGVKHYWLVNPEEKTLECYSLREGLFAVVASGMDEDIVEHPEFPGLSVNLKALW